MIIGDWEFKYPLGVKQLKGRSNNAPDEYLKAACKAFTKYIINKL